MPIIYISETGNDEHDGLTLGTPVRSWQRAAELSRGDDDVYLIGIGTLERLTKEIEARNRQQIYSKSEWG